MNRVWIAWIVGTTLSGLFSKAMGHGSANGAMIAGLVGALSVGFGAIRDEIRKANRVDPADAKALGSEERA